MSSHISTGPILAEPLRIPNGLALVPDRPGSGVSWDPNALAARINAAIEPFAGDVIIKMVAIGAFLRRATA
jgi:hypothetical protein